jgi:urease accessory protein
MADSMLGSAPLSNEVFAQNRAVGRIAFSVAAAPGGSRRSRVHEAGSLRVRFPNGLSRDTLDAVIVNTAGGMAGGDNFGIDIDVGPRAGLTVTTAAAEKVYRSLGADTEIEVKLKIAPRGALAWLPQETILFDQIRLRRSIDIALAEDSHLLLAEAVVFGRSAMGEVVARGHFKDRWRVRMGKKLIFAENVRLEGEVAQSLAQRAIAKGAVAIASVIKYPANDDDVAAIRSAKDNFAGEVGASAWNGLAVARFVAPGGAALRRDLVAVLTALRAGPLPRLWVN